MDEQQEQEWLMQVAGGADPLTGLAAVQKDKKPCEPGGCAVALFVLFCLAWLAYMSS
jgi:hypothetical protein